MHAEGKALTYRQIRQMLRSYSKGEPCSKIATMQNNDTNIYGLTHTWSIATNSNQP